MQSFEFKEIDFNVQMFWRAAVALGIGFDTIMEALDDSTVLSSPEFEKAVEDYDK